MHFLTSAECRDWCSERAPVDSSGVPLRPSRSQDRYVRVPAIPDLGFCRALERSLQPREFCLLWVTTWGVWPSSENWHLYYQLRESYHDFQRLEQAPGHLFLTYEDGALMSFLQVGILNGWDMHLIPSVGYARAFVSHDEYLEFAANEANQDIATSFAEAVDGAEVIEGPSAA